MKYNIIDKKNSEFFKDKKVLVRVGVNVPIVENKVEDDFRLKSILETIEFLSKSGAKIVLLGHIGREESENLDIVFKWLEKKLSKKKIEIFYDKKTFYKLEEKRIKDSTKNKIEKLNSGQVLLIDNIRATKWESENNIELAQSIAENFSIYINEAFSVSHRKHMSIDALPRQFFQMNRFWGLLFKKEMEVVEKIKNPKGKSIFILGGAKIATKIPMLKKMINKFDRIIIGGAVVNEFYKKMGYEVGKSKIDENFIFDDKLFEKIMNSGKIFLPEMIVTERGIKKASEISNIDKILDISQQSFREIEDELKNADFVFFNGPVGYYEGGYDKGTKYLLKILANKNNFFVAGGGNTVSVINELGLVENVDFISTGGGALISKISE